MLEINKEIDTLRLAINKTLDPQNRAELGQFFTPSDIAVFMASLFAKIEGNISLLEPGVGIGSLIVAFLQEIVKRKSVTSITIESYDVEDSIISSLSQTMGICEKLANDNNIDFDHKFKLEDFINSA
jgi:adenine-specific DNA-methyltransferase